MKSNESYANITHKYEEPRVKNDTCIHIKYVFKSNKINMSESCAKMTHGYEWIM